MEIIRGKRARAQRVVLYGVEGIGKSTFAANFPEPLFIDTEGSTDNMDVARLQKPTSYEMLKQQIQWVKNNPSCCKSLVIDTVDWAEMLVIESVCAKYNKKGIEDFGYGNGYTYVKEEMGRLLNLLQELIEVGINVVLTAHAQIRKFEQPDEMGAYDRWELKLGKKTSSQTAPLVKEWADMVLFANYKTIVISTDTKKKKAQGGERVLYTTHHTAWDAKNRHGLPDSIKLDFKEIEHIFKSEEIKEQPQVEKKSKVEETFSNIIEDIPLEEMVNPFKEESKPENVSQGLWDLMQKDEVKIADIQKFTAQQGIAPETMPIEKYPADYLAHIKANWNVVLGKIKNL